MVSDIKPKNRNSASNIPNINLPEKCSRNVCNEVGFRSVCSEVWSMRNDSGSVCNKWVFVQLDGCPAGWSVCSEVGVFALKSACLQLGINS